MEDVCEQMMGIARGGGESLSQKVMRNLSQRLHDDEFWSEAVVVSWDDVAEKVEKRSLSLKRLIECAYTLCNAVIDDYESLSHRVVQTIRSRTVVSVDCMDGVRLETVYGIELYLRRLYLTLKSQSFDVDDPSSIQYVGSRQQCLYGCVCFVVMFFEAYDNFDAVGMKNIDWLMCIVLDHGCNDLNGGKVTTIGKWEKMVLEGVGGGKKVHLSVCVRFGKYEKPERWHDRSWKLHVVSSSYATVERGGGG